MKSSKYVFIDKLRILLTTENTKWTNKELGEYLSMSLDDFNITSPLTEFKMKDLLGNDLMENALLYRAAAFAYFSYYLQSPEHSEIYNQKKSEYFAKYEKIMVRKNEHFIKRLK